MRQRSAGRRIMAGLLLIALATAGCSTKERTRTNRGRGDAPRPEKSVINGDPVDFVIEMPDGWGNVATKCAYEGFRAFESLKAKGASSLVIVPDSECHPKGSGPSTAPKGL